jgi:hypothetical protein
MATTREVLRAANGLDVRVANFTYAHRLQAQRVVVGAARPTRRDPS